MKGDDADAWSDSIYHSALSHIPESHPLHKCPRQGDVYRPPRRVTRSIFRLSLHSVLLLLLLISRGTNKQPVGHHSVRVPCLMRDQDTRGAILRSDTFMSLRIPHTHWMAGPRDAGRTSRPPDSGSWRRRRGRTNGQTGHAINAHSQVARSSGAGGAVGGVAAEIVS